MLLVFAHQPSLLPSPALQFEIPHLHLRYTELWVELRERAAEGSRTLQENDFSGL